MRIVVAPILERLGYKLERAKTNIGLGDGYQINRGSIQIAGAGRRDAARDRRIEGESGMTNTLHRFGDSGKLQRRLRHLRDSEPRRRTTRAALPKLKQFLEMALPFKPVNLGDARHGGALRPSQRYVARRLTGSAT